MEDTDWTKRSDFIYMHIARSLNALDLPHRSPQAAAAEAKMIQDELCEWDGCIARISSLTTTHRTLAIHLFERDYPLLLAVHCIFPTYVRGMLSWGDCRLRLSTRVIGDRNFFVLEDRRVDFEARCLSIQVRDRPAPSYICRPSSDDS